MRHPAPQCWRSRQPITPAQRPSVKQLADSTCRCVLTDRIKQCKQLALQGTSICECVGGGAGGGVESNTITRSPSGTHPVCTAHSQSSAAGSSSTAQLKHIYVTSPCVLPPLLSDLPTTGCVQRSNSWRDHLHCNTQGLRQQQQQQQQAVGILAWRCLRQGIM